MKENLKKQLAQNKTKQVIQQLLTLISHLEDQELHNEVILQSARFEKYERANRLGISSYEEEGISIAKINQALLSIINQLPNESDESIPSNPNLKKEKKNPDIKKNWQKWALAISGIIAVMAGIAEFTGYNLRDMVGGENDAELPLTVTVKVRDMEGNRPLKSEGKLVIDYGNGTQTLPIDEEGKVDVREIPPRLKGNEVSILLEDAKNYIAVPTKKPYLLDGKPIRFEVQLNQQMGIIKGKVRSRDGTKLLAGVRIEVDGEITHSDSLGNFYLLLSLEKWKTEYTIFATMGDLLKEEKFYPNSNTANFEIRIGA